MEFLGKVTRFYWYFIKLPEEDRISNKDNVNKVRIYLKIYY